VRLLAFFRLAEHETAAFPHTLHLAAYPQGPGVEVCVRPSQTQCFTHAQHRSEGKDVQGLEPVPACGTQEPTFLLRIERRDLFLPDLRRIHPRGGVERDEVKPHGLL
jgi:hypothetical protein